MGEDFYATAYAKVYENLKLITDKHVILENPESSSATLSSMKNLDETDNFGDQFLNDKPTEDDQEKTNVVDETDSIIPDPSHQTNMSAPPVTTQVINISSPKPSSQYVGTKIDDALLKALKRHTTDLVDKYSLLPAPESSKKQEFDLKGALFNIMHKNKSANRNPANYRLYHALMEALIEDENAMDKEVADKVKDHKRKHDSDDDEDDDDEGPSAGSN
ncbi:hypothetical protein Tco_0873104 [Tanacetum coccineum]